MEDKRSNRNKRSKPTVDESYWDCSVCTYRNSAEAFKCDMCDIRKGTSTRKPRLNAQVVAQQVAQQYVPPAVKERPKIRREKSNEYGKKTRHPRLKNIDRSSGTSMEVTVNNVTVVITDYKPKHLSVNCGEGTTNGTSSNKHSPASMSLDDVSSHGSAATSATTSPNKQDSILANGDTPLNSSDSFT